MTGAEKQKLWRERHGKGIGVLRIVVALVETAEDLVVAGHLSRAEADIDDPRLWRAAIQRAIESAEVFVMPDKERYPLRRKAVEDAIMRALYDDTDEEPDT